MSTLRYAITDRTQYGSTESARRNGLIAQAERLAAAGIDCIQLREKDLPAQDLIGLARQILNAIRSSPSGTHLLINARADVAVAAGAHGVHLPSGEDQLTPTQVRHLPTRHAHSGDHDNSGHHDNSDRHSDPEQREGEESPHLSHTATGSQLIVSVSCHTLAEVERAHANGAGLILFGPVFGKSVGGGIVVPETGLEALKSACALAAGTPVLALGGVTAENSDAVIAAGAAGIAAIRLFR